MPNYIKKPYVIKANQFGESDFCDREPWVQDGYTQGKWGYRFDPVTGRPNGFIVNTLEGLMVAGPGDYLIRGIKGELYPCRQDIFEETYERVD